MSKEHSNENMQIILNEFGEDIKAVQKNVFDMKTEIGTLRQTVLGFQELVKKQNVTATTDTEPIQEILKSGMQKMLLITSRWPKVEIKRWQILLFPEQDAKLFYKIVFGHWFLWLVISFAIASFYKLGSQWIEKRRDIEISIRQQKNAHIIKAWYSLYDLEKPVFQQKMDKVLIQSLSRDSIPNE